MHCTAFLLLFLLTCICMYVCMYASSSHQYHSITHFTPLNISISSINQSISISHTLSQYFIEARQLKLLNELQQIFPIMLLESGDHTIRGAELPADIYATTV